MNLIKLLGRILAIMVIFSASIAVHECGHYIVVRAQGIPVEEVCLGEGPIVMEGHLPDGALVRLRASPFSGFVKPSPVHMIFNPPSTISCMVMYAAGIFSTTTWACVLFILFAALSGLRDGLWRSIWFGLRQTFVWLLLFPWKLLYGVLTFQSHRLLLNNLPLRLLMGFLLGEDLPVAKNQEQEVTVPHGALTWLGMVAIMLLLCSLIALFPLSFSSDPAMIVRLAFSKYGATLPIDVATGLIYWLAVLLALPIAFLLQSILMLALSIFCAARKQPNNDESEQSDNQ